MCDYFVFILVFFSGFSRYYPEEDCHVEKWMNILFASWLRVCVYFPLHLYSPVINKYKLQCCRVSIKGIVLHSLAASSTLRRPIEGENLRSSSMTLLWPLKAALNNAVDPSLKDSRENTHNYLTKQSQLALRLSDILHGLHQQIKLNSCLGTVDVQTLRCYECKTVCTVRDSTNPVVVVVVVHRLILFKCSWHVW